MYLITALLFFIMLILSTLITAGVFKTIKPINTDMCEEITGVVGAEDITFIPGTNRMFISSYDRRIEVADPSESIPGVIYEYDLDTQVLKQVSPDFADFKPHGFSLYTTASGQIKLFVVDHANQQHQIQIFDYEDGLLKLERTIVSNQITSPNDIVAVGGHQFYVTNDHGFVAGLPRLLEDYLMLPLSNVVFYDGKEAREVASGFSYANGINVNKKGDRLYLAAVSSLMVYEFERNLATNELTQIQRINTGTGVDNIELDENGDLWIGAHPQLLKFVAHAKNEGSYSPSEVIKIKVSDGSYDVEVEYANDGKAFSGSSVAAVKGNHLMIGGVFDRRMLHCQL